MHTSPVAVRGFQSPFLDPLLGPWSDNKVYAELDFVQLCETQIEGIQLRIWNWHVARIISSQKIYGLYGLKHQIVEISGDVTDAGQTTTEQTLKIELLSQWKLEAEFRKK